MSNLRDEVEQKTSQREWWLYRRFRKLLPQGLVMERVGRLGGGGMKQFTLP
jgi:hypothetical protein